MLNKLVESDTNSSRIDFKATFSALIVLFNSICFSDHNPPEIPMKTAIISIPPLANNLFIEKFSDFLKVKKTDKYWNSSQFSNAIYLNQNTIS